MREVPSSLFLPVVPYDVAPLIDGAYRLAPRTRPWVSARGTLHVRLVWRGPDRTSLVLCFPLCGEIPATLLDALCDAMTPAVACA